MPITTPQEIAVGPRVRTERVVLLLMNCLSALPESGRVEGTQGNLLTETFDGEDAICSHLFPLDKVPHYIDNT